MTLEEKIQELIQFLKFIEKTTEDDYISWQIKELLKKEDYGS